jgi:hypothetical protein
MLSKVKSLLYGSHRRDQEAMDIIKTIENMLHQKRVIGSVDGSISFLSKL